MKCRLLSTCQFVYVFYADISWIKCTHMLIASLLFLHQLVRYLVGYCMSVVRPFIPCACPASASGRLLQQASQPRLTNARDKDEKHQDLHWQAGIEGSCDRLAPGYVQAHSCARAPRNDMQAVHVHRHMHSFIEKHIHTYTQTQTHVHCTYKHLHTHTHTHTHI